ncbi:DUF4956 domain-containing protein [Prolixibacteraceae bacterium JC049]|nr:DUF4956 domain-containing protein [Prolixibacteraceae bacterium JC049]
MKHTHWDEWYHFLGTQLLDIGELSELIFRLLFNTLILFLVVHFLYAKSSKRKEFYFSYLAVGSITFLLCFLLSSVKLELGFALGLFAIFGIIRYRTDTIPIKDMTYLFIIIGISVINALSNKMVSFAELFLTNLAIVGGLWFLEYRLRKNREDSLTIVYEQIENIHTDKQEQLMEDLKKRTGLNITRFSIESINFLRDTAEITIFFKQ